MLPYCREIGRTNPHSLAGFVGSQDDSSAI